ncbi:Calcium-dependent lipid-binding (CaLB domain) family protein [Trifolium repens]|nr:Calcium-dependent lipid-binding (CaLB domain) family protein [Trifolium repens]
MEQKTLHLNLTSAKDLKNVNLFAKTEAYAVVSISGDPLHNQKAKTPVDREGGTNPAWNFSVELTFNESLARQNRLTLEIKLRCLKNLAVDKDIGSVQIPLGELLNQIGDGKSFQHVSYQVKKPSGRPKGAFNFSYKFTAPVKSKVEPGYTYAAPAVGSTSAPNYPAAYAPPQQQYSTGYGYGYPQSYGGYQQTQAGYGYPQQQQTGYGYPQQNGYGYPPQQAIPAQKPGKSNFGMGMGAGLIGGALGGLLIGDMISDGFGF